MRMMYALQRTKKLRVVEILDIFAWEHYIVRMFTMFERYKDCGGTELLTGV